MRAEVGGEARGLQGALERLLDVTVIHRGPGLGGEYRRGLLALGLLLAVLVPPLLPLEPRLCELRFVSLQDLPEREAQVHRAAVAALRVSTWPSVDTARSTRTSRRSRSRSPHWSPRASPRRRPVRLRKKKSG